MKANPILEEVWHIKDGLAREAGYDVSRYCEQLRAWSAAHPHPGPIVRNTEELRRWLAFEKECSYLAASAFRFVDELPSGELATSWSRLQSDQVRV